MDEKSQPPPQERQRERREIGHPSKKRRNHRQPSTSHLPAFFKPQPPNIHGSMVYFSSPLPAKRSQDHSPSSLHYQRVRNSVSRNVIIRAVNAKKEKKTGDIVWNIKTHPTDPSDISFLSPHNSKCSACLLLFFTYMLEEYVLLPAETCYHVDRTHTGGNPNS